mmetsp:Transcript_2713/g.6021  ORF Transcript_2713/g.6021 Transcript_2713/m.6021 type:complete len:179 (-) Transcript_2713:40-576(-)
MHKRVKATSPPKREIISTLGEYRETEIDYDSDLPTWRRDNSISYRDCSLEATLSSKSVTPLNTSSWTFRESPSRLKDDVKISTIAFRREVSKLMKSIHSVTHKAARARSFRCSSPGKLETSHQLVLLIDSVTQLSNRVNALEARQGTTRSKQAETGRVRCSPKSGVECSNCGSSCVLF